MAELRRVALASVMCIVFLIYYGGMAVAVAGWKICSEVQNGWFKYLYMLSGTYQTCESRTGVFMLGLQEYGIPPHPWFLYLFVVFGVLRMFLTVRFFFGTVIPAILRYVIPAIHRYVIPVILRYVPIRV
ncbi:hypothetical protein ScPMuIL_013533 [Solemya velum]